MTARANRAWVSKWCSVLLLHAQFVFSTHTHTYTYIHRASSIALSKEDFSSVLCRSAIIFRHPCNAAYAILPHRQHFVVATHCRTHFQLPALICLRGCCKIYIARTRHVLLSVCPQLPGRVSTQVTCLIDATRILDNAFVHRSSVALQNGPSVVVSIDKRHTCVCLYLSPVRKCPPFSCLPAKISNYSANVGAPCADIRVHSSTNCLKAHPLMATRVYVCACMYLLTLSNTVC